MICCLLLFLLVLLLPNGQHRAAMSTDAILDVIRRKSRESGQTSASYLNRLNLSRGGVLKWRKRRDRGTRRKKAKKFKNGKKKGLGRGLVDCVNNATGTRKPRRCLAEIE